MLLLVLVRDRNTWTLLDRKRQIYSISKCLFLCILPNITQTYNTKINKYLELSVAMRNLWCLEKISILPFIISATGIVPQSLFKNLKILDFENTLVVEIQKGILLYSSYREEIP
jgi:hypothetical protein